MSLVFGFCWVYLWWVFLTSWLSEGQSVPTSCFLLCRCGQVVLELVLLCVKGFEAFLLLLFSCLFLVISHYLFVFSDRSWVDLVWLLLPPSPSSLLICWCFLCWWVSSSRRYLGVPSFYPLSFYGRLPPGYGKVHTEPSLICTLPGACGLSSL